MESAQRDPRVGVVLNGRYQITELLGEGGMGLVYRAERVQLGRPVAIKFLHSPYAKSPKYMARFEREARAMSKLSHPYCVSVIDFGVHDEPYIVMDFVTGETLRDLMDRERLAATRALAITRQILAALAHAHAQSIVHRDIKPGNVMVGEATGMGDHVRIFDFGLAKLLESEAGQDHSMATVIGTPAYMAPEQTRAEPIDARADLYAVGVLLFEMLTGEKPFVGEDAYAVIRMQREQEPPLLRSRMPALSVELEQVVSKALQKRPQERFQSAAEFASALDEVPEASGRRSTTADPDARAELTLGSSAPPNSRATKLASLALLVVALVGAFVYFFSARLPEREREPVRTPTARERVDAGMAAELVRPAGDPSAAAMALAVDAAAPDDAGEGSDAGAESDAGEPWARLLAQADARLDQAGEPTLASSGGAGAQVRSISDVHALLERKQMDAAIVGLRLLREKSPLNPYYPYLLGDLYFERGEVAFALAKYRTAIRLNAGYKKRETLQQNAIRALADDDTYPLAAALLLLDVGDAGKEALRAASERDASLAVRERARSLGERLRADD